MGIDVIWNRPRRAQDNGVVERSHSTTERWAEPDKCKNAKQLCKHLAWVGEIQRHFYPSISGQSRTQAYPELMLIHRPYERVKEIEKWDFERVCKVLAQGLWTRLVDKQGQISIYNRNYKVGHSYAGQQVSLKFDSVTKQWVILNIKAEEIIRHFSKEISPEQILNLEVSRRKSAQIENRAKLGVGLLGV